MTIFKGKDHVAKALGENNNRGSENEGETKNGGETGDRESSTAIGVKQRMQRVTGGEYKGQIHMAFTYSTDDLC